MILDINLTNMWHIICCSMEIMELLLEFTNKNSPIFIWWMAHFTYNLMPNFSSWLTILNWIQLDWNSNTTQKRDFFACMSQYDSVLIISKEILERDRPSKIKLKLTQNWLVGWKDIKVILNKLFRLESLAGRGILNLDEYRTADPKSSRTLTRHSLIQIMWIR